MHKLLKTTTISIILLSCQLSQPNLPTNQPTETQPPSNTETIREKPTNTPETLPLFTPPTITDSETKPVGEEPTPSPLPTAIPTIIPVEVLVYTQPQSPVYLVNFLHPELGCQWTGVAGQIFNTVGKPVNGIILEVSGRVDGFEILALGMTGTSLPIGPGGYEIKLGDQPFDSQGALSLRVFDRDGNQLNEALPLITYKDCRKNLILINFTWFDQPLREKVFFPVVYR